MSLAFTQIDKSPLFYYNVFMKKREKNNKINRIEKCLSELLGHILSLQSDTSLTIPIAVYQNLVWNNSIDSANKLVEELTAASRSEYEILHPYPASVTTRDYVLPVLELINEKAEGRYPSYPLSFPCKLEYIYNNKEHHKLMGYIFSVNREYYAAKRIHTYFMKSNDYATFLFDKYYSFIRSSKRKVDHFLGTDHERNNKHIAKLGPYLSFTFNHAIPILDHLNELAANEDFRYSMKVSGGTLETNNNSINPSLAPEVLYHIKKEKLQTNTDNISSSSEDRYYSIKKNLSIECYKMSKWAYLIHIYLMHLFQKKGKICLEEKTNNQINKYFVEEFDAKKVWAFWYNSAIQTNSYFTEFTKAVEELNNIYIFMIGLEPSEFKNIFLLPDTSCNDENYDISRKYNKKYHMFDKSNQQKDIYTVYDSFYKIYGLDTKEDSNADSNLSNKKYYVYIKKQYANYFIEEKNLSEYPKAFAHLSPRTSYSQMKFYELLYDYLPYDSPYNNTTIDIPISSFAFKTGKIDIADWKVNMYFNDINPAMNRCISVMSKNMVRNHRFVYELEHLFIQPAIKKLNVKLKETGNSKGYKTCLHENTDSKSKIPHVVFSLVPIEDALNQ